MKKFSKILCAVLVIAVLCSSLVFMVGAEEASTHTSTLLAGYTASAPLTKDDGAKVIEAIKYPAEDNLLSGAGISSTGGKNGLDNIEWGNEGGRGSDVITYPNGTTVYREYLVGNATTIGEGYAVECNDYVNYTFYSEGKAVDITKVEGQNQYIVVDFDFAYEGTLDNIAMQIINRGDIGAWANPQLLKNFGVSANKFVHITALYNYQDGNTYIFVDGALATTVAGGTLKDAQLPNRNDGKTGNTTEFRVGSNSTSTIYLDNLYIRDVKVAEGEDQLAGNDINAWSGNIYGADYSVPAIPYFAPTHSLTAFENNEIKDGSNYVSKVEGNLLYGSGTGNQTNSPYLTIAKGNVADPYLHIFANEDVNYKGSNNNLFINATMNASEAYDVIGENVKAYYVIDFDVAAPGNLLPNFDVSVVQRRVSDGAGYPFSDEIYLGNFYKGDDEWAHVTIVGDIKNNEAKVFINGVYAGNGGKAVRNDANQSNWLANDTQVKANGFRIELTRNNIETIMSKGDSVAFDNLSERVYVNGDEALTAALADNDLTDWAGYTNGRAGEHLPVIATVNGVSYSSVSALSKACHSNDAITVEFLATPYVPVKLQANATIYTHGMDIATLVEFSESCYDIASENGVYTVKAPKVANLEQEPLTDKNLFINEVKAPIDGNLISTSSNIVNYNVEDSRAHYKLTNTITGKSFVLDAFYGDKMTNGNVYVGWAPSAAIMYEEGVDQHIIFDIDLAFTQFAQVNINPINRNSGNGGVWSNGSGYADQSFEMAGIGAGEFVHITAVMSTDTKQMKVFINGVYVNTVENAIHHTADAIKLTEIRMFSNSQAFAMYDNVALRTTKSAELTAALAANDIAQWSGNVYAEGYEFPVLPPVAIVDGVEVATEADLAAALTGAGTKEVEILHPFDTHVIIGCNAIINTNGFENGLVPSQGAVVKTEGETITIRVPNYVVADELGVKNNDQGQNNTTIKAGHVYFDAVNYAAEGNLFDRMNYNNYNNSGYRVAYLMTNSDTGDKYIYDTVFDTDPTGKNTYQNWYFGGSVGTSTKSEPEKNGYQLGVNQYLLLDFDMAFDVYGATGMNFTTRDVAEKNIAGAQIQIGTAMQNAGVPAGQFAHITILAEVDTNTVYVYVNGNKTLTVANGICNNSYAPIQDDYYLDGIRLLQNLSTPVKFDNIYMRVAQDAALAGLDTLIGTDYNVYTDAYVENNLPKLPRLASVDGVDYFSSATLNEALYGNFDAPKNVVFYHPTEATINVNCDATINTQGFAVELNYFKNGTVTDNGNDTYTFDCGYISATHIDHNADSTAFYNAVKVEGNNNIVKGIFFNGVSSFMNTTWLDENGNIVHGINTYLVSTDGDDNVYAMLARPEGTTGVIGHEHYKLNDKGELEMVMNGDTPLQTGTYFNIEFSENSFTYSASENNYWVYDFDVLVEGEALNMYGYNLIKTADGKFQYGSYNDATALGNIAAAAGKGVFNHITIVADYNNNAQYVFINDVYTGVAPLMGDQNNPEAPATAYVEGNSYVNNGYRISFHASNKNLTDAATFAIDNTLVRKFVTSNSDNLAAAIEAQDITLWTNRYDYTTPAMPLLGTVNGVEYNDVVSLNNAVKESDGVAEVEILKPVRGSIEIGGAAEVNTNSFCGIIAEKLDGYYEFDIEGYGTVKATNKFVAIKNGINYTVTEINEDNYSEYATLVLFFTELGDEYMEEYYAFIYGDKIVAPNWIFEDQYDEAAGIVNQAKWYDSEGVLVLELPVASADLGEPYFELKWYEKSLETELDVLVSVTVGTNFGITLYVPTADLAAGSYTETTEIDGVEYAIFSVTVAPNMLGETVVFQFNVKGSDYAEKKTVKVADYAAEIFAGEYDVLDKNLMAAALVYANEAYKLLGGNADFAALLEGNEYVLADAELTEKLPTDVFGGLIRSAAMYLDSTPKFAFKVAMGFNGNVKFTYVSLGETVVVEVPVNTVEGEELVVLDSFKVYDIHSDITIEFIPAEGETVSGIYNLASYAQSLTNNGFAVALYNLANVANTYIDEMLTPEEPAPELSGHEYTEITRDEVSEGNNLLLVNDSKIKQMDQGTLGDSNGYFTKEGGTAKFILIEKAGAMVEAIYFSRAAEYDWTTYGDEAQNKGFAEHRYSGLDSSKKIASISFDYIINGTCSGEHDTYGEGYLEIKTSDGKYVGVVNGNDAFIEDGEWHTLTWVATEATYITDILVKLYHFNGEFAIANLEIEYAVSKNLAGHEYEEITRDEITEGSDLLLVNDSKIKQMDQGILDDGSNENKNGYFTKEGGTAKFILIEKAGAMVEAIYFSRAAEYDWTTYGDEAQNSGFAEHRYSNIDKTKKIASITFNYIINGTCSGEHDTYGEGYLEIKTSAGKYVGVVNGNDAFLEDGEWHSFTWEATEDTYITDVLFKLYHFNGEFAISNLVITYAE